MALTNEGSNYPTPCTTSTTADFSISRIPANLLSLRHLQVNGCGISPIDSFAYCMAGTDSTACPVLIRLASYHADPSDASFEYVAHMPCSSGGGIPDAGGFDGHGNFHVYYKPSLGNKIFVLAGANRADQLTSTPTANHASLADLSSLPGHDLSPRSVNTGDLALKEVNGTTIGIIQGTGGGAWAYRLSPSFEFKWIGSTLKV